MRIHFMINGIGLGHLHRDLPVMRELSKRHDVSASSFGLPHDVLKKDGEFDCTALPKIGDLSLNEEKIDVKMSIIDNMLRLKPLAIRTINDVLNEFNPELIVVDGYLLGAFVAKTRNIRIISITNCTNVWNVFPKFNPIFEKGSNMISKSIIDISEKLIVPDFAPPYTISSRNIVYFGNEHKFAYVGPTEVIKNKRKGSEVPICMGGSDVKGNGFSELKNCIEKMGYSALLCNGKIDKAQVEHLIEHAPFVVCHGGHTTIMNALSAGSPVISMPMQDYTERVNNSIGAIEAGCGEMLSQRWICEHAVQIAIGNAVSRRTAERAKNMSRAAHAAKGHLTAARIIESPNP